MALGIIATQRTTEGDGAVSVGRDTGYNLTAAAAPVVFAFFVTPFYLHLVGPDRFGILAICWTIVGALGFASLGMGPALSYRLALLGEGEPLARSNSVWTALSISLAASLLGAVAALLIARVYFQQIPSMPHALRLEMWAASPYLAALLPLATAVGVFNGALQGRRRFGVLSAVSIVSAALGALLPLTVALFADLRLPSLILAMVAANAVVVAIQVAVCAWYVPLGFPRRVKFESAKELLNYGAWMSVTGLVSPFLLLLDRFVVGILRGPTAVAVYVLAYNVLQGLLFLPASLSSAMLPRLAPLKLERDVDDLQSSWLLWLNGVLTPIVILAIAAAPPFFRLWIGPTLGSAASPVAVVLLLGCWLHGIGHIASTILIGRNRPHILTKLLLVCLLPYLVLLYFATARFGVMGAAAAWSIRAAFDLTLFRWTSPRSADMRTVALSAALVAAALVVSLGLPWHGPLYWAAMTALVVAAYYQNRAVLADTMLKLKSAAFNLSA
jgi:O-antigen/teichoic acid export membrane protein